MFYCYILECADGSFYTGWTVDVERRLSMHNSGRGAAYTRSHRPVQLVYLEDLPSKSTAMKREYAIKQLTHQQKEKLIQEWKTK